MGIKFLCPNGHRLNVKSFLSGKKALCPKCGVRVTVPEASLESDGDDEAGSSIAISTDPGAIAQPTEQTASSRPTRSPGSTLESASSADDPIDEAPGAVWYVRPASGGQFGPASAEIMRGWIDEGRVGASSLVWRAGWPEWRPAAATFPQLGNLLPSPAVAIARVQVVPQQETPVSFANGSPPPLGTRLSGGRTAQTSRAEEAIPSERDLSSMASPMHRRRRHNNRNVAASAILALISIVLGVIVVIVFRGAASQNEAAGPQPIVPTAKEIVKQPPPQDRSPEKPDFSDRL